MVSSLARSTAQSAHRRGHGERGKMRLATTSMANLSRLRRRRPQPPPSPSRSRLVVQPATPPSAAPAAPTARGEGEAPSSPTAVDHVQLALADLEDDSLVVVAQTAPAVRVAIGEEVGLKPGEVKPGQLVTALREIGFDYVFDVATGADLTIMEEGYELLARLTERAAEAASEGVAPADRRSEPHPHGPLPLFTSCCPGWVSFVEASAPELLPHVSTCKSPHLMLGAVLKSYFGPKVLGIDPDRMRVVSVMPCLKKQGEADREGNVWEGRRDVDHVMTTRELGALIRERGIDLASLPVGSYDDPLSPRRRDGEGGSSQSGSGVLFGTTGGTMEAALRTVYEAVTGEKLERLAFEECRGLDGVKEATVHMRVPEGSPLLLGTRATGAADATAPPAAVSSSSRDALRPSPSPAPPPYPPPPRPGPIPLTGMDDTLHLRVAVCNGLGNAKKLLAKIKDGTAPPYDAVEVMACPGGCVGGGGQPRSADKDAVAARQRALYSLDERAKVRRSHENPAVRFLYERFLGEPLSPDAEAHLHVSRGSREGKNEKEEEKAFASGSQVDALAAATRARGAQGKRGGGDGDHHECDWCGALVAEGGCAPAVAEDKWGGGS